MQTTACTRCESELDPLSPYCGECGASRLCESLSTPVSRPEWYDAAVRLGSGLVVAWLVATVAVAFLRDPKALRDARTTFAAQQYDGTLEAVLPFLEQRPRHEEALDMALRSALRLGQNELAREQLDRASATESGAAAFLNVAGEELASQASALECDPSAAAGLHGRWSLLGEDFAGFAVEEIGKLASRCQTAGRVAEAQRIVTWMARAKVLDAATAERVFLGPLRAAIGGKQYDLASQIRRAAIQTLPALAPQVDEALAPERSAVEATTARMSEISAALRQHRDYRLGRFWCFPDAIPQGLLQVAGATDGWNGTIRYRALAKDPTTLCSSGFALESLGADGAEGPSDARDPRMDMSYRFENGRERWTTPSPPWS
jgi:hypothetical protein